MLIDNKKRENSSNMKGVHVLVKRIVATIFIKIIFLIYMPDFVKKINKYD